MSKLTPAFPAAQGRKHIPLALHCSVQCSKALNNSLGDSPISDSAGSPADKQNCSHQHLFEISHLKLPTTHLQLGWLRTALSKAQTLLPPHPVFKFS